MVPGLPSRRSDRIRGLSDTEQLIVAEDADGELELAVVNDENQDVSSAVTARYSGEVGGGGYTETVDDDVIPDLSDEGEVVDKAALGKHGCLPCDKSFG